MHFYRLIKLYCVAAASVICSTSQRRMKLINETRRRECFALYAITALLMMLSASTTSYAAQTSTEPHREQLLNGLNVLMLHRPGDASALLKLRVHSGAAFDLAGKEGMMALLAETLFPDQATREYVREELGGRLEVVADYDAINITLSGRAGEFERLVELLRNAVAGSPLSNEAFERLREARRKRAEEAELAPAALADRMVAARLFGTYPYGRSVAGTPEALKRINRADLLLARERFLNPNNATLVVTGGVDHRRVRRALRQLLGIWRRSETIAPATFRQPETPDGRTLIIDLPSVETTELRLAVRGLARSDRDLAAAMLLARAMRHRWQAAMTSVKPTALSVRHNAYALSGIFVISASIPAAAAAQTLEAAKSVLQNIAHTQLSVAELEDAKREAVTVLTRDAGQPESLAEEWLDTETYKVSSFEARRPITSLTPAELQQAAIKIFRNAPVAAVAVGSATQLSTELTRTGPVEVIRAGASVGAKVTDPTHRQ